MFMWPDHADQLNRLAGLTDVLTASTLLPLADIMTASTDASGTTSTTVCQRRSVGNWATVRPSQSGRIGAPCTWRHEQVRGDLGLGDGSLST